MKGTLQIITLFMELKLIKYISRSEMLEIFRFWHTYSVRKINRGEKFTLHLVSHVLHKMNIRKLYSNVNRNMLILQANLRTNFSNVACYFPPFRTS